MNQPIQAQLPNTQAQRTGITRRTLTHAQILQLGPFVAEHYTASGMSDPAFARHASAQLGFVVPESSIETSRNAQGIQANLHCLANDPDKAGQAALVVRELQAKVAELLTQVSELQEFCTGFQTRLLTLETEFGVSPKT